MWLIYFTFYLLDFLLVCSFVKPLIFHFIKRHYSVVVNKKIASLLAAVFMYSTIDFRVFLAFSVSSLMIPTNSSPSVVLATIFTFTFGKGDPTCPLNHNTEDIKCASVYLCGKCVGKQTLQHC